MTPMERIEGELSDAQKRIAELERRNVGLAKECQAQQEQITELKNALTRQAKAAQQGMDAAKAAAHTLEQNAARMYAQCNPAALESERAANALLTEQVAKLEAHIAALKDDLEIHRAAEEAQIALREKADEREAALAAHVERMTRLWMDMDECEQNSIEQDDLISEMFDVVREFHNDTNATLTRRDLIKQAEALEEFAESLPKFGHIGVEKAFLIKSRALRRQAEAQQ